MKDRCFKVEGCSSENGHHSWPPDGCPPTHQREGISAMCSVAGLDLKVAESLAQHAREHSRRLSGSV